MTRDEARAELGVDAAASADAIRRSYLRLLKTRKPEVDPLGFVRLRAAYDLLATGKSYAIAHEPEPVAPAPAEPLRESTAPSHETPDVIVSEKLDGVATPAVRTLPPFEARPADVRREAYAKGRLPPGPAAEVARWVASDLFAAAASADVPVPPVALALELLVERATSRDRAVAAELARALERWLEDGGSAARLMGVSAATFLIARELIELPDSFSDELRREVGRILTNPQAADQGVTKWAQYHHRDAASDAAKLLRLHAPSLARVFAPRLEKMRAPKRSLAPLGLVIGGFALLVQVLTCLDATSPPRPAPAPAPVIIATPAPVSTPGCDVAEPFCRLAVSASGLAFEARLRDLDDVANAASHMSAVATNHDCGSVSSVREMLEVYVPMASSDDVQRKWVELLKATDAACGTKRKQQ